MNEPARYDAALRLIAVADLLRTYARAGWTPPQSLLDKAKTAADEYERLSGTDGVRPVQSGRSGLRRWENRSDHYSNVRAGRPVDRRDRFRA